jgi:hypothetical protein
MKKKIHWFSSFYCLLFPFYKCKSMFALLHSDINSLKSGLLHFTDQPYCKNCRSAKGKDGVINLILRNYLIDEYIDVCSTAFRYQLSLSLASFILPASLIAKTVEQQKAKTEL